jgi:hypothetical protein
MEMTMDGQLKRLVSRRPSVIAVKEHHVADTDG